MGRYSPRSLRCLSLLLIAFTFITWFFTSGRRLMAGQMSVRNFGYEGGLRQQRIEKPEVDVELMEPVLDSADAAPAQRQMLSVQNGKVKRKRVDPWADLRVKHWSRQKTLELIHSAAGYTQRLTDDMAPVRSSEQRQRLCDKFKDDPSGIYSLRELLQGNSEEYACNLAISGNLCRPPPPNILQNKRPSPGKPRIMCWLLSSIKDKRKKAVQDTWGQRCDFMVYTAAEDSEFPTLGLPVPEGRNHIASKAVSMWVYIYLHFLHEFDFFYKGDPDTYAVIPNLRHFVKDKDPDLPLYYGNQFHIQDIPWWRYASGGPGELLSSGAVRVLVEHSYRKHCHRCIPDGQCEDCKLARCFYLGGVNMSDSRDSHGRERFLPQPPWQHLIKPPKPGMYDGYNLFGAHYGHDCCAEHPVSFHYVKPTEMYVLDYFFHRWKVAPYDEPSFDSYSPVPTDLPQMGQTPKSKR